MIVHADNTRTTRLLATEDKARRYIDAMGAALAIEERTTATALVEITRVIAVKALLTQALDAVEATPKHRGK